ncbi:hypothetical protein [Acetobacter ghanensis]|uniref:Uncharacterized protein n=1 Tax=Acetobacter ghanensis TaxID=431306 RepID=A0A0U5F7U1_9PROT|nr:hypothetical protein [Acetobacter ghanensis]NHO39549.1 hypothetical protein [Acetobacter ghanensis]CEF54747.1 hypothetical protein predicted by Glimmer/Critica [Acetobacter ghanensis]
MPATQETALPDQRAAITEPVPICVNNTGMTIRTQTDAGNHQDSRTSPAEGFIHQLG